MKIDRKKLFDGLRQGPFPGRLNTSQVQGISAILDAYDAIVKDNRNPADLAYILATPIVETGWTMQPIKELGGPAYFFKMYDPKGSRPAVAKQLGNTQPGDGAKFPGYGFVQTTGRGNAIKNRKIIRDVYGEDVDFEADPSKQMIPKYAAAIMIVGMLTGSFTGKKLGTYTRQSPPDFVNARRVVNGTDRAQELAGYAKQIYADILTASA